MTQPVKNDQGAAQSTLPVIQADIDLANVIMRRVKATIEATLGVPVEVSETALPKLLAAHRIEHSTPDRNAVLEKLLAQGERLVRWQAKTDGCSDALYEWLDEVRALTTTQEPKP